jgi:hypothetical protein
MPGFGKSGTLRMALSSSATLTGFMRRRFERIRSRGQANREADGMKISDCIGARLNVCFGQ